VKEGTQVWTEGPAATTSADGSFAFALQPRANLRLAAIYDGDTTTWGSESAATIGVEPLVTLGAEGALPDAAGTYHYPPGTERIRFFGGVRPRHPGYPVYVRIRKVQDDGSLKKIDEALAELDRNSDFVLDWDVVDPAAGGTYHADALFPKDDDHARGVSPAITFVIDPQP